LLPCVDRNDAQSPAVFSADRPPFAYDGRPPDLASFQSFVQSYDFGTIRPDQLVLHNTANPDASWASLSTSPATWWDQGAGWPPWSGTPWRW
jgi:hypothetical protein